MCPASACRLPASALLPWVNGEILLLSHAALLHSPWHLTLLTLLASGGQMVGKCVLYWAGREAIPLYRGHVGKTLTHCRERIERSSSRPMGLVFLSSLFGIPPFYVISILAGAVRLRFGHFIAVGTCGRFLHFGVLALVPQFAIRLSHYAGGPG